MKLPKAEYPLTDIFVFSLDKTIGFRPFLVKEERILNFEEIQNKTISVGSADLNFFSKFIQVQPVPKLHHFTRIASVFRACIVMQFG